MKFEDLKCELAVLQEDLQVKIEENEGVHIKIFHLKAKYKEKKGELRDLARISEEIKACNTLQIKEMSTQISHYKKQITQLEREYEQLQEALRTANAQLKQSQQEFEFKQKTLTSRTEDLEWKLRQQVSLHDTGYEYLGKHNAPKFNSSLYYKQTEAVNKAVAAGQSLLIEAATLASNYVKRLQFLYENSDENYKFIISKMNELIAPLADQEFSVSPAAVAGFLLRIRTGYSRFLNFLQLQLPREPDWLETTLEVASANSDILSSMGALSVDL